MDPVRTVPYDHHRSSAVSRTIVALVVVLTFIAVSASDASALCGSACRGEGLFGVRGRVAARRASRREAASACGAACAGGICH